MSSGAQQFRKKPVVIEAIQFTGDNDSAVCIAYWMDAGGVKTENIAGGGLAMVIDTLEGPLNASPGDWIIKGVKGEFYPCKPDIFDATYEAVLE